MRKIFIFIILAAINFAAAEAMPDSVSVGIVNCYPGAEVYELEGHSAIHIQGRIQDQRVDFALNYGVFDFNSPNFLYRFVKGETDYMCAPTPWPYFIADYASQGRKVVEYPVHLDSVQSQRLVDLVLENLEPQNRVYRYNYVLDNCATRPLRIIEKAIGDSIILPEPSTDAVKDHTFREVMEHYHSHYPWYQFGIDLALGSGIDYPITPRQKSFAPIVLDAQLAGATVGGKPLCSAPIVHNEGTDVTLPPTPWYLTPNAVAWLIFIIAAVLTVVDLRRGRVSRWFDALLYTAFGICGLVLTFLIFVSVHEATSPNWLYLWLNPLCLVVPIFIWLKKCKIVVFSYQIINFALLIVMVAAWQFTGQKANTAFFPLICSDALRAINYIIINLKTKQPTR